MTNLLLVITGIFLILQPIVVMILFKDIQQKDEEIRQLMSIIKIKNIEKFKN